MVGEMNEVAVVIVKAVVPVVQILANFGFLVLHLCAARKYI